MQRVAPFALLVAAVGLIAAIFWTESLLASRPQVPGFADGPLTCFSVLETPSGGAHKTPRRDLADQARLPRDKGNGTTYSPGDYPNDDVGIEEYADDCQRARTVRVATVAALGAPLSVLALVALVASAVPTVRLARDHRRRALDQASRFSSLAGGDRTDARNSEA